MPTEAEYRAKAQELYTDDGTLEVDDNAVVSVNEDKLIDGMDNGAYVQAWVWVSDVEFEGG